MSQRTLFKFLKTSLFMTQRTELNFSISFQRHGLHSINIPDNDREDAEVCGCLGKIEQVAVEDNILLVCHGKEGTIRVSLPDRYLDIFKQLSKRITEPDTREDSEQLR